MAEPLIKRLREAEGRTPGPWEAREASPNWEIFGENRSRWVAYAPKAVADELRDGTFYPSLSETAANARLIALAPEMAAEIERLTAENARLRAALAVADDAIREMFRYYDGGETRGSYDGKPERAQLRKAGYIARAALSTVQESRDAG